MPQVVVAVVGIAASYGATAALGGLVEAGIISSLTATLIGSLAGLVVTTGLSFLLAQGNSKASLPVTAADRKQTVRSAVTPRNIVYGDAFVSGPVIYIASSGSDNEYFHIVVPIAGHVIDRFVTVRLNSYDIVVDTLDGGGNVVSGDLSGLVRLKLHKGDQTTADSDLVSELPSDWDSNHKLLGIAYIYCRIKYSQDKFPYGFQTLAAHIRGKPVFDPRSSTTGWTNNAALCILDYLQSADGLGAQNDEIDTGYWNAAANICDETVAIDVAGDLTQLRFSLDGSFKLDQTPIQIMDGLLTSCAGTLTYVQGLYRLHVGAYETPTVSLGPGDFAGDITVVTAQQRKNLFNTVTGTFIDPSQNWSVVGFPQVQDSDLVAADGGVVSVQFDLPYCIDSAKAQRMARLYLLRARVAGLQIQAPLKYSMIQMAAWDTVSLTFPDFGWNPHVFRVTAWKFDPVTAIVTATMQAEDPAVYTWNALDAGPPVLGRDTTLTSPLSLTVPSSVTVTPSSELNGDGQVVTGLLVAWSLPPNPWVTSTEVQWKVHTDSTWSSREVAMPTLQYALFPVIVGTSYDIRVRYIAGLVRGPWSDGSTVAGAPDTVAPGVPTDVTAVGVSGGIAISWTNPSDHDLDAVEVIEGDGSSNVYVGEAKGIPGGTAHFLRSGLGGNVTRSYNLRARDRSRNYSDYTGYVATATSLAIGNVDFASGIQAVGIYPGVPTEQYEGLLYVVNSTNNRLLRWDGAEYIYVVNSADMVGQITAAQILANEAWFDQLTAGIGSFGGLRATELIADEVLITSSLQVGDSIITTGKIGSNAVSETTYALNTTPATIGSSDWEDYLSFDVFVPTGAAVQIFMRALASRTDFGGGTSSGGSEA